MVFTGISKESISAIIADLNDILDLEREIKGAAVKAGDDGTEDLMSDFIDEQEKTLWMMGA